MQLTVTGLAPYGFLGKENEFNAFGGNGENISPALSWENVPENTKSFAITVYDPDAPTGSGFWHWVAYDIPRTARGLAAGAGSQIEIAGQAIRQAKSDFGQPGYGGCCPPEGAQAHRYIFTLHALGCENLGIDAEMPNAVIRFMIQMNSLQSASAVTLYQR